MFAEHADRVIEAIREHEDEWLAELRSRLPALQEQRREAERMLAEARAAEYGLLRVGSWLMNEADDEGFSRQPAPNAKDPMPNRLSQDVFRNSLERPWHKVKPWNGPAAEPQPEAADPDAMTSDPTGARA